ncbi:MAG: argininosuccinate lyase, partial [Bacteroidota bacterium]
MKLWQKENTQTAELIEQFTVGRDKEFDLLLARHDVSGSIAHATMLGETGLMTAAESKKVTAALEEIGKEIDAGRFSIA